MRSVSVLLAMSLLTAGCSSVLWLNPVIPDDKAVFDEAILGRWQSADGDDTYVVRRDGETGYEVVYSGTDSASGSEKFTGRLFRSGELRLLDLIPKERAPFQIRTHFLVRLWLDGDRLRLAFLNAKWFQGRIAARQLPAQEIDEHLVITAAGKSLLQAVLEGAGDDRAFEKAEELRRLK